MYDGACIEEALHGRSRIIRPEVLKNLGAEGRNLALYRVEVLNRDRQALQRPQSSVALRVTSLGLLGLFARPIEEHRRQRVDLRIDVLAARD
jgi:hypothetical protein